MQARKPATRHGALVGRVFAMALLALGVGTSVVFTQNSNCMTFLFEPTTQHFGYAGKASSVTCTKLPVPNDGNYSGCAWTASSNASWIMLTGNKTSNIEGTGTVPFTVAENFGPARSGTITFSSGFYDSSTYTITQDAAPGARISIVCSPGTGPTERGVHWTTTCTASGGSGAYEFSIFGILPSGIEIVPTTNPSTLLLAGTPNLSGAYSFSVRVTDQQTEELAHFPFNGTIAEPGTPTIELSCDPASGPSLLGVAYSTTCKPVGEGADQYFWTYTIEGQLPGGLTLSFGNSVATIAGTPTVGGSYSYTLRGRADFEGGSFNIAFTFGGTIVSPSGTIACDPAAGPTAVGVPFSQSCTTTLGTGGSFTVNPTWTATGLPAGLALTPSGTDPHLATVSGTPTTAGDYRYTLTATLNISCSSPPCQQPTASITISGTLIVPAITLACTPDEGPRFRGVEFMQTCAATGDNVIRWSASGLPQGLRLIHEGGPTAVISGTPSDTGDYRYTIIARAGSLICPAVVPSPCETTRTYQGTLGVQLTLSCLPSEGPTKARADYHADCAAAGGEAPYTWSIDPGELPEGLALTPAGPNASIDGAPQFQGEYAYTVRVEDSGEPQQVQTQAYSGVVGSGDPIRLSASPMRLVFNAREEAPGQFSAPISVFSTGGGASFSASASGGSWLSATGEGATPGTVQVTADSSGLPGGNSFNGVVVITGQGTTPRTITIPVTLNIAPIAPPALSVSPAQVQLSAEAGSAAQFLQLRVVNTGGGDLHYSAERETLSCGSWLELQTVNGTATPDHPGVVSFSVSPAGLPVGTCSGEIRVSGDNGQLRTVPVVMVITGTGQSVLLTETGVEFEAEAGGSSPLPHRVGVVNAGSGSMSFEVSVQSDQGWLRASPGRGTASGGAGDASLIEIAADSSGLDPGRYYGSVNLTAPDAVNSPKSITVALTVLASGAPPRPEPNTGGVILFAASGTTSEPATVLLLNHAAEGMEFSSTATTVDGPEWLMHSPQAGTIPANGSVDVNLQADASGLTPGIWRGSLRIAFGDGSVRTVGVALIVPEGLVPQSGGARAARLASGTCSSTDLVVQFLSPAADQVLEAQQPVPLEVAVRDCQNHPVNATDGGSAAGAVSAQALGSNDVIKLAHQANGVWTGSWTPPAAVADLVLRAEFFQVLPSRSDLRAGADEIRVGVGAAGEGAAAVVNEVQNAATNASPGLVAPGAWVALKGVSLSEGRAVADTVPYPKEAEGTQVLLRNQRLPLYFVSDGQVNALIPSDLDAEQQQLIVVRGGTRSAGIDVLVTDLEPGLFSLDSTGSGQGAIIDAATGLVAGPFGIVPGSAPVGAGDFISIFATGFGAVTGEGTPPTAGDQTPFSPLFRTVLTPEVTIGGVAANVTFSGLAPGLVGVYQVNAKVPGVAAGSAVPVEVTIGGLASNTVTIAVK